MPSVTQSPSTIVDDSAVGTLTWSNPSNAGASDNSRARAQGDDAATRFSHYLKATNFGFSIPSGATITGVQVSVERIGSASSGGSARDEVIKLVVADTVSGDNKAVTTTDWPFVEAVKVFGSSSDLWGLSLGDTDINSSDFGCVIQLKTLPGAPTSTPYGEVDHVTITVHYTSGGNTYSETGSGGIVVSGIAETGTDIYDESGSGGIVISGTADVGYEIFSETGSGGVVLEGSGGVVRHFQPADLLILGVQCGGTASLSGSVTSLAGSGGVVAGGDLVQQTSFNVYPDGGVVCEGQAIAPHYEVVYLGGDALHQQIIWEIGSGGLVSEGAGQDYRLLKETGTGGVVLNGSGPTNPNTWDEIASGGVVCDSAVYHNGYHYRTLITVPADKPRDNFDKFYLALSLTFDPYLVGSIQEFRAETLSNVPLATELRDFDTETGKTYLYVKTPLSTTADTEMYIYFGAN